MLKGIKELLEIVFLWGFLYMGAIFILVLGIVHIKSNQPIIQEQHFHHSTQVYAPPKRVLMKREMCKDPRGCELLKGGACPSCVLEDVWE